MATVRLTGTQAATLAAVKALGMPTEVFRFTEHNGDQTCAKPLCDMGKRVYVIHMTTTTGATVETYSLRASNGRPIRTATRVTLANGRVIAFIERMSKREALRQAAALVARELEGFEALGRQAFTDGLAAIPGADPAIREAITGLPVGGGAADIMRAWSRGWTAANLAAPIV